MRSCNPVEFPNNILINFMSEDQILQICVNNLLVATCGSQLPEARCHGHEVNVNPIVLVAFYHEVVNGFFVKSAKSKTTDLARIKAKSLNFKSRLSHFVLTSPRYIFTLFTIVIRHFKYLKYVLSASYIILSPIE